MELVWHDQAWEDYLFWQKTDVKTLARINELIKDATRNHFKGLGKPEPLKGNYAGYWSRRISAEHRLVYSIRDKKMEILQCRFHYDK